MTIKKVERKKIHATSKLAKEHGKRLVETIEPYLELNKAHKDWYNRRELGKQRGKPRYAPPKERKARKDWRKK